MKEKTLTFTNWTGKDIQLDKDGFVKRWMEVSGDLNRLMTWRDLEYTQGEVEELQSRIKALAEYIFELKADDVAIHYGVDGLIKSKRIGNKQVIKNGKEVV
jgi:hypothetical protein|tara:strand:- start:51 stop:353 length:303 start_codon:yes stop_codon:yes gene_type:complete